MKLATTTLLALALLAGCKPSDHADAPDSHAHEGAKTVGKAWHCPMHPQIVRDRPGNCPICGMDLVEFAPVGSAHDTAADSGTYRKAGKDVVVEPSVLQKIGVRSEIVDRGSVGRGFQADAEGVLDRAAEASVTVRAMGYVESAPALREGDPVKAGQILATFYSPDIVAAQGDWLSARAGQDSSARRIARERLGSLGVSPGLLEEIGRNGQVLRAIPLVSPVTGWIRTRGVVRGQSAMAGQELYRIVEGAGSLLEARIPLSAAAVRSGDLARVRGDGIQVGSARVVSVVPEVERSTRSAVVRLAPQKGVSIRVGAQYQVEFDGNPEKGLVVPENAVLHSGTRDVVFLALGGGKFRPVVVTTGPTSDGRTLLRTGLEAGDEVVVSAQFLLDGESRLRSALDQLTESSDTHAAHGGM